MCIVKTGVNVLKASSSPLRPSNVSQVRIHNKILNRKIQMSDKIQISIKFICMNGTPIGQSFEYLFLCQQARRLIFMKKIVAGRLERKQEDNQGKRSWRLAAKIMVCARWVICLKLFPKSVIRDKMYIRHPNTFD